VAGFPYGKGWLRREKLRKGPRGAKKKKKKKKKELSIVLHVHY
jgi:hypothetical protein